MSVLVEEIELIKEKVKIKNIIEIDLGIKDLVVTSTGEKYSNPKEILKIKINDLDNNLSGVFIERLNQDCTELSHIFTVGVGNLTGILMNIGVFIAVFIINRFLFYLFCSLIVTCLHVVKVKKVNEKSKEKIQD